MRTALRRAACGLGLLGWLVALGGGGVLAGPEAVLHLRNGGYVPGRLAPTGQPELLRWQSPLFTAPFEFPTGAFNAAHFAVPPQVPKPEGDYCFELAGGDVVFGSLIALEADRAEVDIPRLGKTRIDRGVISRIYRWRSSADLVYLGPNGLSGWQEPSGRGAWKEEQGQPWTDQDGAQIRGDLGLPARASVEFEISWKNKPDFVFALGAGGDEKSLQRAFRFEVWERDVIIQRETEQEADVASVGEIAPGPGRIHLVAYLDQEKGRVLVFNAEGKPLADLKVASAQGRPQTSLSLANKRGDLRLERLRISRWNGEAPRPVERGLSRIHRADGSILYGTVKRFDPARKSYVVADSKGESTIAEDQIAAVYLTAPEAGKGRSLAVVYQDGTRISGELLAVEKESLSLRVPGVAAALSLPTSGLRSLVALGPPASPAAAAGQAGMLELDGARLPGCLIDGGGGAGKSCLVWQPQGSRTASPLGPAASGRIVYREAPKPRPQPQPAARQAPPQGAAGFVTGFLSALGGSQPAGGDGKRKSLFLRSGDVIPSEVASIDERGVTFRTALSASTFVPHDKVQAVELAHAGDPPIKVTRAKRDRLLTLPRMQKENPPTHLVRSRNGDYLRGRLLKLDEKSLEIEIRLETKSIPRDRLATVVWLHPEPPPAGEKPTGPAAPAAGASDSGIRVQAVCNDGIRLTFVADRLAGGSLSGKSDVLGPCKVLVKDVDQLLIGGGIEQAASQMVYQQWKLQDAPEPRAAKADAGSSPDGRPAGTESAMVGKPAPDFELELLDGKKFRLADRKGKAVILDFWATWCGPCLQAMPQVEQAAGEFKDRGVELIAVNLQEEAAQIRPMLERHKLHPTVALDRDGAVAEKYAATAIPQTVIIDREGNVARLFVGSSPHLLDQLRGALQEVVQDKSPKPAQPGKPAAGS